MAPSLRNDLPLPEWKKLLAASGNRCAFPKCGRYLYIPGEDGRGDVAIARAAHIVGASRQGPRGDFEIGVDERDRRARNRVVLCPDHHDVVDQRSREFTVQVLRAMKVDHERKFLPPKEERFLSENVMETLRATIMPVVALPSGVMSATLANPQHCEGDIARAMRWPTDRCVTVPFIIREGRLHTFASLRVQDHPFAGLVRREEPHWTEAAHMWGDPEGHRRYVALLNKALTGHLGAQRIRYDREHHRYWFLPDGSRERRTVVYSSKQGRRLTKEVVRRRVRRSTGELKEWVHVAADLRFEHVAPESWVLAVRPEFQFTSDGQMPLSPKQQGSKSTRKKSHIYNEGYLDRVHFWVEFLGNGSNHMLVKAADQRIRVRCELQAPSVRWPGVPLDTRPYTPKRFDGGLLTLLEEAEVIEPFDSEGTWWGDNNGGDEVG
jgi:hypothetical protein